MHIAIGDAGKWKITTYGNIIMTCSFFVFRENVGNQQEIVIWK